ncbi:MAG: Ig-like domain-containing protein, partial [Chloroflexota bacterium]|nr:Ig-like domain-containing protein [Chloroflexota bacterium]
MPNYPIRRSLHRWIVLSVLLLAIVMPTLLIKLPATPHLFAQAAQPTPAALPPLLLATSIPDGAVWNGERVTFTFDQPLAAESATRVSVAPDLIGAVAVDDATITFTPGAALEPGMRYRFRVDAAATATTGIALGSPVELTLTAALPLQVTSTQPGHDAAEIDTDSGIVIVFNRPVVPLTGIDDGANLPQPLTIEPMVEGNGIWLNTSVYAFQPGVGLAGATLYNVKVDNLTGLNGETLAEPVKFSFTTAAPLVIDALTVDERLQTNPTSAIANPIRPDAAIQVLFSQPMDPASTANALRITQADDSAPIEGEIRWQDGNETLIFTPTMRLEFGAAYTLVVETGAQPFSRQGNLRERFERTFNVLPLPAVRSTTPADGDTNVTPEQDVTIRFNTAVSPTMVLPNLQITPLPTTTQVYSYYSDYNQEAVLSWNKEPQTTYTVTVGGAIADEYGNTLGQETTLHFTTGDYAPFARIHLDRFTHFSAYTTTRVAIDYQNMPSVDVALYRLPSDELFRLTGKDQYQAWENYQVPNPEANRIWAQRFAPRVDANVIGRQVISLTDQAGEILPPGVYLLEVAPPQPTNADEEQPNPPSQALIILSDYNLVLKKSFQGDSLAWLTDLRRGEPVAGKTIRFYDNGKSLAESSTGANGVVTYPLTLDPNENWTPLVAISGEPGEADFAVVSSEWNSGVAVWDFGLSGGYNSQPLLLHFYTDRPIYRPGQTVYWKGIVRRLQNDQYEIPPVDTPLHIVVRDDRGNLIQEADFRVSEQGTL